VIDLESGQTSALTDQDLSLPPKGDTIRAVTVARLIPVKRLERFIQAISIARQAVPNLQGVIVGSGPEEEKLRRLSDTLGLTANPSHPGILFLGQRSDIPQILSRMDISIMTSDQEGFPNIILEAMAARLPIISTPAGEAKDLIQNGINGYLIPFNDIDRLSQQIIHLAKSPELRLKLGEAGRRIVEQEFSYPRLSENLLKTYQDIARYDNNKNAILSLNQIQHAI
jgi:glycosyltransferase involved in cell wall biosynthesis